ncbi:MAG: c-type cytochrome [Halieaceae bacterium]
MRDLAYASHDKLKRAAKAGMQFTPNILIGLAVGTALVGCGGDSPEAVDTGAASPQKVVAVNTVNSGHPAAGLYSAQCSQCHNGNGSGHTHLKAPSLTTLDTWYVERQLTHFRDGVRGANEGDTQGKLMAAASANLSDEDIELLADYVADLPPLSVETTLTGDLEQGKDYHLNLCAACHGSDGLGNEALSAPAVAGVNDWYLVAQYEHFRAGRRGTHADDQWGAQMHRLAPSIPEDVVISIASYHATLPVSD